MKRLNLVGRQVSRLRYQRDWSQEELAGKLQLAGWLAATRSTVSKIEGGTIYVHDFQVSWLAAVLGVPEAALYPRFDSGKQIQEAILSFIFTTNAAWCPYPLPLIPACSSKSNNIVKGGNMENMPKLEEPSATTERLAYSIQESADLLGVNYFSVYRLIQRGKLKLAGPCAASCWCHALNC